MLNNLITPNAAIEEIEPGLFTCLPTSQREHDYDEKTAFYDIVIGNPIYNRLIWGNKLSDYRRFCRQALDSRSQGAVLDAGCGSLVFTGAVYAGYTRRPLVLVDRSLGMLRRAKSRLLQPDGRLPENVILFQADLFAMPFRHKVFETVQSFGMLHIFEDTPRFLQALLAMKSSSGSLYFNSLVGDTRIGQRYLKMLHDAGEVGKVYTSQSLTCEIEKFGLHVQAKTIGNMAYYSC